MDWQLVSSYFTVKSTDIYSVVRNYFLSESVLFTYLPFSSPDAGGTVIVEMILARACVCACVRVCVRSLA